MRQDYPSCVVTGRFQPSVENEKLLFLRSLAYECQSGKEILFETKLENEKIKDANVNGKILPIKK